MTWFSLLVVYRDSHTLVNLALSRKWNRCPLKELTSNAMKKRRTVFLFIIHAIYMIHILLSAYGELNVEVSIQFNYYRKQRQHRIIHFKRSLAKSIQFMYLMLWDNLYTINFITYKVVFEFPHIFFPKARQLKAEIRSTHKIFGSACNKLDMFSIITKRGGKPNFQSFFLSQLHWTDFAGNAERTS